MKEKNARVKANKIYTNNIRSWILAGLFLLLIVLLISQYHTISERFNRVENYLLRNKAELLEELIMIKIQLANEVQEHNQSDKVAGQLKKTIELPKLG